MPQAIAAFIVSAIGLTGAAASIATAVLSLGISLGLNFLVSAIFGQQIKTPKPSDVQQIVRQAISARLVHFGTARVGGTMSFLESKDGTLWRVVIHGYCELVEILEHRLNDVKVTLDADGFAAVAVDTDDDGDVDAQDDNYNKKVRILTKNGTATQTAHSLLVSAFPGVYTTAHRLLGCANTLTVCLPVKVQNFSKVYTGNREPQHNIIGKWTRVYDPRKDSTRGGSGSHRLTDPDTWEYSDNAALIIAWYRTSEDGYGSGLNGVNWDRVATEADIADQTLLTVDGRTIKRWRLCGTYSMDDDRRDVESAMLAACDGFSWENSSGQMEFRLGRWTEPTVHLNGDHIKSFSAVMGVDPTDRTNEVRVVYVDPRLGYIEQECSPVQDADDIAATGQVYTQRVDALFCPDHNQASRIGKRALRRLLAKWNITLTTNLFGLSVIGEMIVLLTIEELGMYSESFEVTAFEFNPGSMSCQIALSSVSESDFLFDSLTEEGDPPPVPGETSKPVVIPVPTGLAVVAGKVTLSGSAGVALFATWDDSVHEGFLYEVQFKKSTATTWRQMSVSQDDRTAESPIVDNLATYNVRMRAITYSGRVSDWTSTVTVVAVADTTPPSPPTSLSSSVSGSSITISFVASASANHYVSVISRSTSPTGPGTDIAEVYSSPGAAVSYVDAGLSPGTYYYWVRCVNASAVPSTETGPTSKTVS